MLRVLQTADHFGVRAIVCINKADIYPVGSAEIETYCEQQNIEVVGKIPFDMLVTQAMVQGQPVTAYQPGSPASRSLREVWRRVVDALERVA
jgi:MinD superfamily P-loop ATPase